MQEGEYDQDSKLIDWEKLKKRDEVFIGDHPVMKNVYLEDYLSTYPSFKVIHRSYNAKATYL
jgi:hypothetical protein